MSCSWKNVVLAAKENPNEWKKPVVEYSAPRSYVHTRVVKKNSKNKKNKKNDPVYQIPEREREAYYALQDKYGDVPGVARAMIETGREQYEKRLEKDGSVWKLRDYKTVIKSSEIQRDREENKEFFLQIAYLKVPNNHDVNHFIVYVRVFPNEDCYLSDEDIDCTI